MALMPGPPGEVGGAPGGGRSRDWIFPAALALLIIMVIVFGGGRG